jgi:hypothetical protein
MTTISMLLIALLFLALIAMLVRPETTVVLFVVLVLTLTLMLLGVAP